MFGWNNHVYNGQLLKSEKERDEINIMQSYEI